MDCPEKRELQRKCTAAWDAYEAEALRIGLLVDHGGVLRGPTTSDLIARARNKSIMPVKDAYQAAMKLRGEHMTASRELSHHLTHHRC